MKNSEKLGGAGEGGPWERERRVQGREGPGEREGVREGGGVWGKGRGSLGGKKKNQHREQEKCVCADKKRKQQTEQKHVVIAGLYIREGQESVGPNPV